MVELRRVNLVAEKAEAIALSLSKRSLESKGKVRETGGKEGEYKRRKRGGGNEGRERRSNRLTQEIEK